MSSRIRILNMLGQGGMGEVFLAELVGAEGFRRQFALKRSHRKLFKGRRSERNFVQEALICSKLDHPNIVQVFDFGRNAQGQLNLLMEYVKGAPLSAVMDKHLGPFACSTALYLLQQLLCALKHAHTLTDEHNKQLGIIHRDVKPSNILVTVEGRLKLTDFGLALIHDRLTDETQQGTIKGTAAYMSPEQTQSLTLDHRTDLFSAGIIFWELLVGERLFKRATDSETRFAVCSDSIVPPAKLNSKIPSAVNAFAMKLLERDLKTRFKNAQEALNVLMKLGHQSQEDRSKAAQVLGEDVSRSSVKSMPQSDWLDIHSDALKEASVFKVRNKRGDDFSSVSSYLSSQAPEHPSTPGDGRRLLTHSGLCIEQIEALVVQSSAEERAIDKPAVPLGPAQSIRLKFSRIIQKLGFLAWAVLFACVLLISIFLERQLEPPKVFVEPVPAAYTNVQFKARRLVFTQKPKPARKRWRPKLRYVPIHQKTEKNQALFKIHQTLRPKISRCFYRVHQKMKPYDDRRINVQLFATQQDLTMESFATFEDPEKMGVSLRDTWTYALDRCINPFLKARTWKMPKTLRFEHISMQIRVKR